MELDTAAIAEEEDVDRRLGAAISRAKEMGLPEKLLDVAYEDPEWRESVESALRQSTGLGRLLRGGAQPKSIWQEGLLRKRVLTKVNSDPLVFRHFAWTHPALAEFNVNGSEQAETIPPDLDVYAAVLASWLLPSAQLEARVAAFEAVCEELEREREAAASTNPNPDDSGEEEPSSEEMEQLHSQIEELNRQLAVEEVRLKSKDKDLKELRKDLRQRKTEISRKDRKAGEVGAELASLRGQNAELEQQVASLREERAEARRAVRRLEAQVKSDNTGMQTIEDKRLKEVRELRETIDQLRERLRVSTEFGEALSVQVATLERDLAAEREQRNELELAFSAFGMDDLLGDSHSFSQAVDALVRFRDSVSEYAARQQEREEARKAAEREALAERERAAIARQAQLDADEAWRQREQDRLLELEAELFGKAPPDHVIIDGHNLVHRVYRPEDEARTRPWLEKMVLKMAERVESYGWDVRFHLAFDSKYPSNKYEAGHGMDVYFENNVTKGGADARIARLLEEGNPHAHYLVVSTDRKHVWSDALERVRGDGQDIDLVQVELLASYLQVLDHLDR